MTEPTMSGATDANCVRKVVSVEAPQVVAWRVFTEKMGTWCAGDGIGMYSGDRNALPICVNSAATTGLDAYGSPALVCGNHV